MEMNPVLVGSPVITAICAPGGSAGLPGPHLTPVIPLTTCMSVDMGDAAGVDVGGGLVIGPAADNRTLTVAVQSKAVIFMESSPKFDATLLRQRERQK